MIINQCQLSDPKKQVSAPALKVLLPPDTLQHKGKYSKITLGPTVGVTLGKSLPLPGSFHFYNEELGFPTFFSFFWPLDSEKNLVLEGE